MDAGAREAGRHTPPGHAPATAAFTFTGAPLPDSFDTGLGQIETPQGTHVLLAFYDPVTETDYIFQIVGTDGNDTLIGTAGDDNVITKDTDSNGDLFNASAWNDTIDMSGMNQPDAWFVMN